MLVLNSDKFTAVRTQTEDGLRDAVEHFSTVLAGACIGDVVTDLLSEPNLFVYMFSGA